MDTLTSLRPADALLIITGILFVIQILYYLCRYARILRAARAGRRGRTTYTDQLPPLSVVIYAHEECDALRRNLPAVLGQDYPQFEVIVVNEGDSDGSSDYLSLMETRHANLRHTFVPDSSRYISHKKLALTLGFKAARHDWLVLTDADCRPTGDQWLRTMARNLVPGIQIVLGYSGYERGKGWLHKRAAFDNLFLAMRYLGAALARHPYMGVGRNLLYSKTFFNEQKGFAAHLDLLRGDDDLFITQRSTVRNTRVEADPAGHCPPEARVVGTCLARGEDWPRFHRRPLSRHATVGQRAGDRQPIAVPRGMGDDCRPGRPVGPMAHGGRSRPGLPAALRPPGRRCERHGTQPGREAPVLPHAPRLRPPASMAIPAVEAGLPPCGTRVNFTGDEPHS